MLYVTVHPTLTDFPNVARCQYVRRGLAGEPPVQLAGRGRRCRGRGCSSGWLWSGRCRSWPKPAVLQPALAAGLAAPAPASCHVLLVDDERLTRTMVSTLLQKCGYRGERAGRREGRLFARSQAPPRRPVFKLSDGRHALLVAPDGAQWRANFPTVGGRRPPRPAPPALPQRHRLLLRPHTLCSHQRQRWHGGAAAA